MTAAANLIAILHIMMLALSLCTGPRHGGAGAALLALLGEAGRTGATAAVTAWLARRQQLPGFGHPLYPEGDVRAVAPLGGLAVDQLMEELRQAAHGATGALPNLDSSRERRADNQH
jgi:citrate synthase